MGSKQLLFLTVGACLAAFIVSIDSFIINVALPTIAGYLGIREEIAIWLLTLFTMPYTLAVPLAGWLCLRYGNRLVFLWGMVIFTLGCFLCLFTQNFSLMLFFRIVQGFGAGMIIPCSLGMIMLMVPPEKRGIPMSFWGLFVMVGPAMGPVLGGLLSNAHWHYLFFVSIPFALFAFFAIYLSPTKKEQLISPKFDLPGLILMGLIVGPLQVILNRGQVYDWFYSKAIIILTVTVIIALPLFIIWELYNEAPFVQLRHFKKINFTLPTIATAVLFGCLFSSFTLDVYWTYHVLGYPPIWTGLILVPVGIFPLLLFPFTAQISKVSGKRLMSIVGSLIFALSFFLQSRMNEQTTFAHIAGLRLLQGVGIPFITFSNAMLVIEGVENKILTAVISFYQFMRVFFTGLGVSIGVTLWIHRIAFYQTRITSHTSGNDLSYLHLLSQLQPYADSVRQLLALSYEQVQMQAATLGLADIYYLYGWIALAISLMVCFCKEQKQTATIHKTGIIYANE